MKRRMFALTLAVLLALSAAGCGGGNQKALVGTWEITDDAGSAYGWGIRFDQDGTFFFAAGAEDNDEELEEAFAAMQVLYTIEYKVKSDTELELTQKLLGGLGGKETTSVAYSLPGRYPDLRRHGLYPSELTFRSRKGAMFHAQLSPMRRRAEGRRPLLYRLRPPGFTGYRILRAGARRAASAIRAFKPGAFCFPVGGAVLPTAAAVHAAPAADPYRGPARLQRRRLEQRRPRPRKPI